MKKIICLAITIIFTVSMLGTGAAAGSSESVSASGTTGTVTVKGTVSESYLAVVVVLYDNDGKTMLRTQSAAVNNDRTFSAEFDKLALKAGAEYTVKAANYNGGSWITKKFTTAGTVGKPAAPTKVKAKAAGRYSVKVTWKKSAGATSYKVYKATKKKGKYKLAGTVKGSSKTVKKLKANKKYWFKVRAVNKTGHATSKAVTAKTKKEPVSFTVKNSWGTDVKVHWKTVKGAKGYQIANNDTAGKKMKTYWTGKTFNNTYTSVNKTRNKTYKFKMRYYKVKNGKRDYSSWTKVKSIKVR
ncbi:MAG: fibronectin type III domain-containing protein [Eubacteriaceae bacterium]|nr:fibronectin type III domain-containing protein [Eubacteriaceae bacterium]